MPHKHAKTSLNLHLSLYLRNAPHLNNPDQSRVDIVDGDVMDYQKLVAAMEGQDVVYANLSGNMKAAAENIVKAMHASGLKRKMLKTLFSGRRTTHLIGLFIYKFTFIRAVARPG